ncbi:hypothetical protein BWZ22_13375 [Seonamhaeicola sp. S2-3]|nr:hypothetical protein BWZ22_13375 [Seonamhaeicola sp. S2-3]
MNKKLRTLRLQKGLSQENIAFELGISQKAYSKIENGESSLSHDKMIKIAEILGTTPKEICPINKECSQNNSNYHKLLNYLKEKGIKIPDLK